MTIAELSGEIDRLTGPLKTRAMTIVELNAEITLLAGAPAFDASRNLALIARNLADQCMAMAATIEALRNERDSWRAVSGR